MFEFSPRSKNLIFFALSAVLSFSRATYAQEPQANQTLNQQATEQAANTQTFSDRALMDQAIVERVVDVDKLVASTNRNDWYTGEILVVVSQNARYGVIGFVEVISLKSVNESLFEMRLSLQRQSRKIFIQPGDHIRRLDLSTGNPDYVGTTDLLLRNSNLNVSSRYRPLVYQGLSIGDTAQTLYKNEFLVNYLGNMYYGVSDWFTVGSLLPANVLGRPNLNFRARVYDSETTTLATGFSFVRLVEEKQASLNMNFYWDSISSDSLISHTFVGIGLATWDGAADAAALKYLTSNSFQTGYEIILDNWDRFLVGPSYNFEKKALGGYLSYVWAVDRFHLQVSVNATDITSLRLDPTNGYYGFFDMYWRF